MKTQNMLTSLQTYFQTETGCHAFSPLAGVSPIKPGTVALPFFGIIPTLIDPITGEEIDGNDTKGVLAFKQPWPSIMRTVWGDHSRYMKTYFEVYRGYYVNVVLSLVKDFVLTRSRQLGTPPIETKMAITRSWEE